MAQPLNATTLGLAHPAALSPPKHAAVAKPRTVWCRLQALPCFIVASVPCSKV